MGYACMRAVLASLIGEHGPAHKLLPTTTDSAFHALANVVISQQLSIHAAANISKRLAAATAGVRACAWPGCAACDLCYTLFLFIDACVNTLFCDCPKRRFLFRWHERSSELSAMGVLTAVPGSSKQCPEVVGT